MINLLVSLTGAAAIATNAHVHSQEKWEAIVSSINNEPTATWKARVPLERVLHGSYDLFGGLLSFKHNLEYANYDKTVALPTDYDTRTAFPQCSTIQRVRDQCGCGSCFAFGAIEAFEDRICIHLKKNITLSVEDIISCHDDENMSCQGGNPIAVWQNIFGGSKEGDGAIQESCYPYQIKPCPCNHHNPNSTLPKCTPEGQGTTPTCSLMSKFACENKGVFKATSIALIPAALMEQEIHTNGPITVAYEVYDDFLTYTSGIYQRSNSAKALGGHSVKIVGYGVENGVKYWTVANSWNHEFGEDGFFRIIRGVDECGIESQAVVAGMPVAQ